MGCFYCCPLRAPSPSPDNIALVLGRFSSVLVVKHGPRNGLITLKKKKKNEDRFHTISHGKRYLSHSCFVLFLVGKPGPQNGCASTKKSNITPVPRQSSFFVLFRSVSLCLKKRPLCKSWGKKSRIAHGHYRARFCFCFCRFCIAPRRRGQGGKTQTCRISHNRSISRSQIRCFLFFGRRAWVPQWLSWNERRRAYTTIVIIALVISLVLFAKRAPQNGSAGGEEITSNITQLLSRTRPFFGFGCSPRVPEWSSFLNVERRTSHNCCERESIHRYTCANSLLAKLYEILIKNDTPRRTSDYRSITTKLARRDEF